MNRHLEQKLKKSLDIYLPNDYSKKKDMHFVYLYASIFILLGLSFFIQPITLYFHSELYLPVTAMRVDYYSEIALDEYPIWHEDGETKYQYQQNKDALTITYQKENPVYLTIQKQELPLSLETKSSNIGGVSVYLAYQKDIYQAIWEQDGYTIVVQMNSNRNQFIQEIKHIMEENLS